MSFRNLSPQAMFEKLSLEHRPRYLFEGRSPENFRAWKEAALPQVLATIGAYPDRVPLNPQLLVEWQHGGLRKQKWIIDVQPYLSATLLVNIPPNLSEGERRPAILCWPGHGPFGKEAVMGNDGSPELRDSIQRHNYDYGRQMAEKGFVTFAIDWIGIGDRNDNNKPNWRHLYTGENWCNLYYLGATMLGTTSIALNVAHAMAATDFVCSLPMVDRDRLGVMGLSGGGTMTVWSALCDERFKAAEVICYSDLWAHMGYRDLNYCGMQVAPGLFNLVDIPELHGLIAPRPLLEDIGAYDSCFLVDTAKACYDRVEQIYAAAGAGDRLELDLFPGEHGWGGNKSEAFFKKHLRFAL